ncbi:protein disulfide-isomerase domain [Pneumocystis murina B123]|uniref:protein disulfide-isomerase n=1 Tax=Pneumocystis murina (strain B123) TaxID=1069680 RepID=M7PCR5_PNEMU|nr:protein disulfide-isomerase domain [Pneumocystis murina B123]EMR11700.1 protein disulfide-isomerase domain [Pneumocystis murina B123]
MNLLIYFLFFFNLIKNVISLYGSKDQIQVLTSKNFFNFVKDSKHLSIVEFFAPWCGYCRELAPIYKKFAEEVSELINVIAIDCNNHQSIKICERYEIKGFPTIKFFIPQKGAEPKVENYEGPRTLRDLMLVSTSKIPNYVKKITDNIELFLEKNNMEKKIILFTNRMDPNGFFKTLALDFYNQVQFILIHQSYKKALELFEITKFPTIIFLHKKDKPVVYSGKLVYKEIYDFIKNYVLGETQETVNSEPVEEPKEKKFSLTELNSENEIFEKCIFKKGISIVVLSNSASNFYLLSQIAKTYNKFSYYFIDKSNVVFSSLLELIQISFEESEIILLNGQKGWYVTLQGKNANEILKVISTVMTGENIEKKKLDLNLINMISKVRRDEL